MHGWRDAEKGRWKQRRLGGCMDEWMHRWVGAYMRGEMQRRENGSKEEGCVEGRKGRLKIEGRKMSNF